MAAVPYTDPIIPASTYDWTSNVISDPHNKLDPIAYGNGGGGGGGGGGSTRPTSGMVYPRGDS